ncbi:MAG: type II toxin-antitoxin system HipA family toxin [Thermodesulfobacteriota bacterium]
MISRAGFERIVFIELPGEMAPVPAGLFSLDTDLGVGRFRYGNRYMERPNAIPLDPVNLPLVPREYQTRKNKGIFGPLCDLLPDSWGRFILAKRHNLPFGTLRDHELLDLVSTQSVGALTLGLTPEQPTTRREQPVSLADLGIVAEVIDRAMADAPLSPEIRYLLQQGTSLGGAQPKCAARIDGEEWIAKFASSKTLVRYPALEFATMTLARQAGITVPEIRLERIGGRAVYLVRRFDREHGRRLPFLSGFALANLDIDELEWGSYIELATSMRTFVARVGEDLQQLFRRMAFNMHVRNQDDHLRNHGFLCGGKAGEWCLSPAYDLVPTPARRQEPETFHLSLQAGTHGSEASLVNLLSAHAAFGLRRPEALEIIREVRAAVRNWESVLRENGVSGPDIASVRWCFEGFIATQGELPG